MKKSIESMTALELAYMLWEYSDQDLEWPADLVLDGRRVRLTLKERINRRIGELVANSGMGRIKLEDLL